MAFDKKEWEHQQIVSHTDMNRIEDGIANSYNTIDDVWSNTLHAINHLTASQISTNDGGDVQSDIDRIEHRTTMQHSIDEQMTGQRWVNGKPIYTRIVIFPPAQGGAVLNVNMDVGVEYLFYDVSNSYGIWDSNFYPLIPVTTTVDNTGHWFGEIRFLPGERSGIFRLSIGRNRTFGGAYVCVRYTKR